MVRYVKLRLSTAFLIIFFLSIMSSSILYADTDEETILSALALNYCRNSLVKIQSYNDRIVLDEEYNNIINNIDLSKINDEEIIELLEELMDTLSYFKLQEGDKDRLTKKYEKKVSNAFYSSFSGVTNVIYAGGGNPFAIAAAAVTQMGGSYANYRNNLEEYRNELDDKMWQLEKEAIEQINDIQKTFLRNSWVLMKKWDIPDSWRLTDSQLNEYVEILKDENIERRLRKLEQIAKYFEAYPPYWYYLGVSSIEGKRESDASEAFKKFNEIRQGFFREDTVYTSAIMNEILLLDTESDKKKILNLLNEMVGESTKDWRKNLFAALKYAECKHFEQARELIQINIDNERNVSLNMRVLGDIYMLENNNHELLSIVDTMVEEDRVRGQDVLYFLGKVPEIKMLNKMKNEFTKIDLSFKENIIGKDDIELFIPIKWIIKDFEQLKIDLMISNKGFNPTSITSDEKRNGVVYMYEKAIYLDDVFNFEQKDIFDAIISLNHPSGSFKIKGQVKQICNSQKKGLLSQGIGKAKSLTGKILGSGNKEKDSDKEKVCDPIYIKQEIITQTGTYVIKKDKIIKKL